MSIEPRSKSLPARHVWAHLLLALAVSAIGVAVVGQTAAAQSSAAETPPGQFVEEARVTAIEIPVAAKNPSGAVPAELKPEDFTVAEEGEVRPVTQVEAIGGASGVPWRLVIYADLATARAANLQAAALSLAERAEALTALGEIEIWVADPAPMPLLPPTRDRDLLGNALARLLLEFDAKDEVNELRRGVLAALKPQAAGEAAAMPPAELVQGAIEEEAAIAERSRDALLTWAARELGSGPRALLLLGGGYDLDPAAFYRKRVPEHAKAASNPAPASGGAETLARALAAYGWLTFPLTYEQALTGPSSTSQQFEEFRRRGLFGTKDTGGGTLIGGTVPLGGKSAADAESEKRENLLLAGTAPLAALAEAGGVEPLDEAKDLDALAKDLGSRKLVTFQVERQLDGQLRRLEVKPARRGWAVAGPRWVRSSTPEPVAEARVRRILVGEPEVGDLAVSARYQDSADGRAGGTLTVRLDLAAKGSRPPEPERAALRVTVAWGPEDGRPTFQHKILLGQNLTGPAWSYELPLALPPGTDWIVAVVEDLASGAWGARDVAP